MKLNKPFACLLLLVFAANFSIAQTASTLNPSIESKIDQLLKQMTLEEKVGQMAQVSIESLGGSNGQVFTFSDKMKDAVVNYKLGSILNSPGPLQTPQDWNRLITEIQDAAKQTRLKIPVLYGLDDIHGVNYAAGTTLFPQEIGQAATWNRHLIFDAGKDVIKPASFNELDGLVAMLKVDPKMEIQLEGHTDNVGNAAATSSYQKSE